MSLARTFEQASRHLEVYNKYRRLIAREKRMIDLSAIIYPDDFFVHVLEPFMQRQNALRDHFLKITPNMFYDAQNFSLYPDSPVFTLNLEQLDERTQAYLQRKEAFIKAGFPSDKADDVIPFTRYVKDDKEKQNWIVNVATKDYDLYRAKHKSFPCMPLQNLFGIISKKDIRTEPLNRHEAWSVITGNGADILQFWKDVRAMKDYSGFFPHKPRPRGDNTNKKAATVWKPAIA